MPVCLEADVSEIKIKNAGDREIKVTIQTTRTEFPPTWATVSASDTTLSFDVDTTQYPTDKSGCVGGPQPDDYIQPTPPSIQDVAVHSAIRALKAEPHGNRMGCAQWIEDEET